MPYQGQKSVQSNIGPGQGQGPPNPPLHNHGTSFGTSHKSSWKPTGRGRRRRASDRNPLVKVDVPGPFSKKEASGRLTMSLT
ncbi:Hypothetical protein FKW44_022378 [Caligus rogercresseyi]|uniref:Uncharacterized protein n=1 Tax=Caligus rogercresseyi TaxID=217165 RepID=A0A7T8GSQ4_CALRO|nr:Hypothetical protein FKW44_022378 [Caligus rogercresseyi]